MIVHDFCEKIITNNFILMTETMMSFYTLTIVTCNAKCILQAVMLGERLLFYILQNRKACSIIKPKI